MALPPTKCLFPLARSPEVRMAGSVFFAESRVHKLAEGGDG